MIHIIIINILLLLLLVIIIIATTRYINSTTLISLTNAYAGWDWLNKFYWAVLASV